MALPLKPEERRLRLGEEYEGLVSFVRQRLPDQEFRLTYEDGKGDHVTIASQAELAHAIEVAKTDQRKALRMAVTPVVPAGLERLPAEARPFVSTVELQLGGATECTVSFGIPEAEPLQAALLRMALEAKQAEPSLRADAQATLQALLRTAPSSRLTSADVSEASDLDWEYVLGDLADSREADAPAQLLLLLHALRRLDVPYPQDLLFRAVSSGSIDMVRTIVAYENEHAAGEHYDRADALIWASSFDLTDAHFEAVARVLVEEGGAVVTGKALEDFEPEDSNVFPTRWLVQHCPSLTAGDLCGLLGRVLEHHRFAVAEVLLEAIKQRLEADGRHEELQELLDEYLDPAFAEDDEATQTFEEFRQRFSPARIAAPLPAGEEAK